MDLPAGWHLSIEDRPSPAARNRLGRELGKHNRPYLRSTRFRSRRRNFIRNSVTASSAGSIIRPTSSAFSSRSG